MIEFVTDFIIAVGPFTFWYIVCGILTALLVHILRPTDHLSKSLAVFSLLLWPLAILLMIYGFFLGIHDIVRKRRK